MPSKLMEFRHWNDGDPVEQAEKLLRASGAKIEHSPTGGAYYNFLQDTIRLPSPEGFRHPMLIMRPRCTNSATGRRTPTGWTVLFATRSVRKRTRERSSALKLLA
jgi:hypothetical protein